MTLLVYPRYQNEVPKWYVTSLVYRRYWNKVPKWHDITGLPEVPKWHTITQVYLRYQNVLKWYNVTGLLDTSKWHCHWLPEKQKCHCHWPTWITKMKSQHGAMSLIYLRYLWYWHWSIRVHCPISQNDIMLSLEWQRQVSRHYPHSHLIRGSGGRKLWPCSKYSVLESCLPHCGYAWLSSTEVTALSSYRW